MIVQIENTKSVIFVVMCMILDQYINLRLSIVFFFLIYVKLITNMSKIGFCMLIIFPPTTANVFDR